MVQRGLGMPLKSGSGRQTVGSKNISLCMILIVFIILAVSLYAQAAEEGVLFREEFDSLDAWEPLTFAGIDRQTQYSVAQQGDGRVLKTISEASASALVYKARFSIGDYPILHWRWKVDKVYTQGNYRLKSGDDYPLRVFVFFPYDPDQASWSTQLKYALARTLYGRYPPHNCLNYIWANREEETEKRFSPYTDRALMIPLQQGRRKVGRWIEERVNLLEDYRRAFGEKPPPEAVLAIMNDADDTGEGATAYMEFIEVTK